MKIKRIISIVLVITLMANSTALIAFAENESLSAEEFSKMIYNIVYEYDSSMLSSTDPTALPPNRLIIKTATNGKIENNYGAVAAAEGYNGLHIFQYETVGAMNIAYEKFSQDNIEYVEKDFYLESDSETFLNTQENTATTSPSWNSATVDVTEAFDYINSAGVNHQEVDVAIIDSGLYIEHTFFDDNRIEDSEYILSVDGTDYPSIVDDANHGTHVTGTIYDNTTYKIKLYPYRVFVDYLYAPYSLVDSVFNVAVNDGADIINLSMSGRRDDEEVYKTLSDSISNAVKNGVVVVAAAGNDRADATKRVPGNIPEVITVAATDKTNSPDISYSASGDCVDVAAPGTNINSTVPRLWTRFEHNIEKNQIYNPTPQSLKKEMSGTSMAAPLVSAAAATLKSIHPEYTPADIQRIIKETAYVPDGWDTDYGVGIVNFLNMVKAEVTEVKPKIALKNGKIEITAPEGSDSRIYYTLDGTVPTIDNHLTYTSPFDIGGMNVSTITAVCHENGKLIGEPVTFGTSLRGADINLHYKYSTNPMPKEISLKADWRSSNPNIASVDYKGNITGVSPGTTFIYANRADGMKMTYKVTVDYALWQEILIKLFFGFLWYI